MEQAAQGCIDSLNTPEAISYRRRMGFRDEEVRCSVVICEMVVARSAGVAFSCDPVTGRRDVVVIDAAEDLGDVVVSGKVNPRARSGAIRLDVWFRKSKRPPARGCRERRKRSWRTRRSGCSGPWAKVRHPQDVEWAWDGERLWLLQAAR